ncbi:MAG: HDOD domain-containing protein [Gammaproteobacteria bacterium]|nr:HDOD domain-containing protein [Gammaproteobacteria bacterium]
MDRWIDRVDETLAPPEVFVRINELADDPFGAAPRIEQAIEDDPALKARLLAILNSRYFAFPSNIDSISRAMAVLGARELRDLVLVETAVRTFGRLDNPIVGLSEFWQHSLYCAVVAHLIAERRREERPEQFFAIGLFHDIGSLLLFRNLPELSRECLRQAAASGGDLDRLEEHRIGFSHSQIGAALASRWGLPPHAIEAIRWHHRPLRAPRHRVEAALIHIAEHVTESGAVVGGPASRRCVDPRAWSLVGLTLRQFEGLFDEVNEKFEAVRALLFADMIAA